MIEVGSWELVGMLEFAGGFGRKGGGGENGGTREVEGWGRGAVSPVLGIVLLGWGRSVGSRWKRVGC